MSDYIVDCKRKSCGHDINDHRAPENMEFGYPCTECDCMFFIGGT